MLVHMHCYEKLYQGNLITSLQLPVASPQEIFTSSVQHGTFGVERPSFPNYCITG